VTIIQQGIAKMQQGKKRKIIKSFSQLKSLDSTEFYKKGKLKPIDKRLAVSMARQLADGFDELDLHKEPTKYQYQKARKILDTWFSAQNSGKSKTIRPSKKNRKYYSEFADMPSNFKVYSMPILEDTDKFKIKKGKLIRKGKFVNTEDYLFKDVNKAVLNPIEETEKLVRKIERDYKGAIYETHLKTGRHDTKAVYNLSDAASVIEKWSQVYDNFADFAFGLRIFTFNGQQAKKPTKLKLKSEKQIQKQKGRRK
jgi:hypothetical protein